MNKKKYYEPLIEVVKIDGIDVITASNPEEGVYEDEGNEEEGM